MAPKQRVHTAPHILRIREHLFPFPKAGETNHVTIPNGRGFIFIVRNSWSEIVPEGNVPGMLVLMVASKVIEENLIQITLSSKNKDIKL